VDAACHTPQQAIAYCHEQRIAHRDVKPENYIFADQRYIENGGKLKLVDFGFSCKILPDQLLTECLGTGPSVQTVALAAVHVSPRVGRSFLDCN
jgi:serine/threonine protein kinase